MKLYTKTVCPKCILVKNALQRNNLEAEVINIDQNEEAKEYLLSKGFMGLPVLDMGDGVLLLNDVPEIMDKIEELK